MRWSERSASLKASSAILHKPSGITIDLTGDEATSSQLQTSSTTSTSKITLSSLRNQLLTLVTLVKTVEGLEKSASNFEIWAKKFSLESGRLEDWLSSLREELVQCQVSKSFMTEFIDLSNLTASVMNQILEETREKEQRKIGKIVTAPFKIKREMDDEMLYSQFQTIIEIVGEEHFESSLFFNQGHQQKYEEMLKRGVIPHRPVNFDFLESRGIKVQTSLRISNGSPSAQKMTLYILLWSHISIQVFIFRSRNGLLSTCTRKFKLC